MLSFKKNNIFTMSPAFKFNDLSEDEESVPTLTIQESFFPPAPEEFPAPLTPEETEWLNEMFEISTDQLQPLEEDEATQLATAIAEFHAQPVHSSPRP